MIGRVSSGAITLTLASTLLLSGIWCIFFSPIGTYSRTNPQYRREISIEGLTNWTYLFSAEQGDSLEIFLHGVRINDILPPPPDLNTPQREISIRLYDPDDNVVWSETNVTGRYFNVEALKSGVYRIEVQNLSQDAIECYIGITVSWEVTYRPLEPLGQWLSLVSLPIFALGIWASGVLSKNKGKEKEGMIGKTVRKISKQRSLIFAGFLLYGLLIGVFSYWADGRMETFRMILNLPGVEISMRIYNYYLMPYWVSTLEPVGYEYIDCVDGLTGEIIGQEKVPLYSLPIEEEYDLYIPVSVLSWGLIGLGVQLALSMNKIERERGKKE